MRLRGGHPGMVREWRALSAVFATTLVKSVDTSARVFHAMEARGFTGTFPVSARLPGWHLRDTFFLGGAVLAAVCGVAL
jgi:energy-coupling factor transporter transmembrane protein EcfT